MEKQKELIILFDGVCNLCNSFVQFIIRNDKKGKFKFASLQSDFGQHVLQQNNLSTTKFYSFFLLEDGKIYRKSTAALRVAKRLNGAWPLLYALIIIPAFLRNLLYDWIAKNRYKWFGKKEECWIPTPELEEKFIS